MLLLFIVLHDNTVYTYFKNFESPNKIIVFLRKKLEN